MSWCTIESDPGVFSELISEIGVKGVEVVELYDLELTPEKLDKLGKVHGLIFLFKWEKNIETDDERPVVEDADGVFFARQVINNACGTQAILSVLMNSPDVNLGNELTKLKDFSNALPADMRGLAIGNSDVIRTAHNSFARPEPFISDEKAAHPDDDEDLFHFVGYVPVNGILYELDGLKPGPIVLGDCDGNSWVEVAGPAIRSRMDKYTSKEIRCALLAVVQDRLQALNEKLQICTDPNESKSLQEEIEHEQQTRLKWKRENVRRKHNYVPFVFNLLKSLAEKKQLDALVENAKKTETELRERLKRLKAQNKPAANTK